VRYQSLSVGSIGKEDNNKKKIKIITMIKNMIKYHKKRIKIKIIKNKNNFLKVKIWIH